MTTFFCPHCNRAEVAHEYFDGTSEVVRCEVCGLPIEKDAGNQPSTPAPHLKLLFIDDDQFLLGFLREFATTHGFLPLTAPDGRTGISLAIQERPDLIIIDAMLPAADGFDVCRRMRAEPDLKDTPILIFTALQDPTITAKGMKVGATLTLTKALTPQQFLTTIKTLLTLEPHPPTASAKTLFALARNSVFLKPN